VQLDMEMMVRILLAHQVMMLEVVVVPVVHHQH
jgi:hypothetical protein